MIHASNSSSSIKYEKEMKFTTHARVGISLYGLTLDKDMDFLKNTYRLLTNIAEIKHLEKGEKVGYGATYTAQENEIIGVIPIGYADGFIRKNQNGDVESFRQHCGLGCKNCTSNGCRLVPTRHAGHWYWRDR